MKGPPSPAQLRWWASPEFRAIGRASAQRNLKRFANAPRCGATKKSNGEPCRNPGTGAGGRCRLHGGRTGSGQSWHKPVWPNRDAPDWEAKLNRKLRDLDRAEKRRQRRLAAMSDDERAAHRAWQASHVPGPPGPRALRRAQRQQDAAFRASLGAAPLVAPPDPELAAIEAEIAALRSELAAQQAPGVDGVFA
jgi:hypothetical protein